MKKRSLYGEALYGATLYEFKMQIRRKALWITFALLATLSFPPYAFAPWEAFSVPGYPIAPIVADWSLQVQQLHPLAFGLLLADRLPRDRRSGASELLGTLPASPSARFLGKYLGATLATLLPLLVTWAVGVACIARMTGDLMTVPLGIAAFLTVNLPGLLFVAAFSVVCPVIMWIPLYQFLFIGYWFWGNLLPEGVPIPTLTGTHLTPFGEYTAESFFESPRMFQQTHVTVLDGVASMGLLLGLGALALVCGYAVWQRRSYA